MFGRLRELAKLPVTRAFARGHFGVGRPTRAISTAERVSRDEVSRGRPQLRRRTGHTPHGNADDTKRKFNRTENLRPIPLDDPDFDRLYARRNDAESINRHLDDTLWLRRAHSIGHLRQALNLLTYALCINGLALHLHRRRQRTTAA